MKLSRSNSLRYLQSSNTSYTNSNTDTFKYRQGGMHWYTEPKREIVKMRDRTLSNRREGTGNTIHLLG
jgi:hypothetical protein